MHVRIVRGAVRSAALAAAVTGTLTWAPAATAQPSEPTPSASAAPAETPAPDAGSIAITKKDAAGDVLPGAAFLLLDSTGQEAGRGKTDAQGKLTFPDLAPGVYRLKETASGSPLHEVVADQDVIVTPGATTRLTISDPFKAAKVLLQAKDDKTGKLLPGSTVNIGSGGETLLTLTTGSQGTASGELPVTSRKTEFWVKQVTAPEGYDLYKPAKTFTAGPGAPVTVTVTNAKTGTTPKPNPSDKPTDKPSPTPSTPEDKPTGDPSGGTSPASDNSATPDGESSPVPAVAATEEATPKAPGGSLAHTGADGTPWLLGGAGLLIVAGGGALVAARRRRTHESDENGSSES
ncbi:SpaA isopeptide-forming pilin-related protein [Streptomyces scopuliridis]|uniref:SpaA isopeptide-forming pilin-related protein n=1 Tax=Streptomyces scopuliridis TaxID=452529 RepID=A0ACD4ZT21_9ACTN|nr:SpaA isopeptide-forming pilin-related protein [Streptomyces scopuliridis]WSC01595.1 SpaA isopeptide-forming pilin-related protein [Streptomyces scopuliridis]WSC04866.1 SpaA isopeptide-forming pilin-related protein [Streptomyces scopuliridis]